MVIQLLYNKPQILKEFRFLDDYNMLHKVIFCGITDVLNDFIIDGLMGECGIGEMTLIHQNIQNCKNLIEPENSIFTFDRGFVALEFICRFISMNTYFVIRLRKDSYIEERKNLQLILQDIYSTFLTYNIFCYSRLYLNTIINRVMRRKGKTGYYDVDQSNLISRIKEDLFEIILNPTKENIRF